MGLGLALWPALAGFLFLILARSSRYWAVRQSGYHLVFASAIAGVVLFAVARLFVVLLADKLPPVEAIWTHFAPFEHSGAVGLSFALALIGSGVWNRYVARDQYRAAKKAALMNGDLVEWVLQDSADNDKFVEVSLRSGKSYVGLVQESGVSRRQNSEPDIALIPLASGYRDNTTRELKITTDYSNRIFSYLNAPEDFPEFAYEDFRVVLPISEVISARVFDWQVFELFSTPDEESGDAVAG